MPFDNSTSTNLIKLNCQTCGACCVHSGEVTVMNAESVPRYLTRSVRGMMGYFSDDHYDMRRMARVPLSDMNNDQSRCVALHGNVGTECRCKIYTQRPDVCRGFSVGSEDCRSARRQAGLK